MGNDRIIISAAILGVVLSLTGAGLLIGPIQFQRKDLQLTANEELMENLPPEYALPYMAMGAFRGVMVNVLWVRLEQMKQDGQFWEAMQLSELITKLQPRFPQVWANRAWNMGYNISVATHTESERWMWVNAGLSLLRDQAIPLNPNSVICYKELGWHFLHKVGMDSDDLHRYYKAQLAREWHEVLGEPPQGKVSVPGADGKPLVKGNGDPVEEHATIASFRKIAVMFDKYINTSYLGLEAQAELRKLLADPDMVNDVRPYAELPASRLEVKLILLRERLEDEPKYAARLDPLLDALKAQQERAKGDPVEKFRAGEGEEVVALLDELAKLGYQPDTKLVQRVGVMRAVAGSDAGELMGVQKKFQERDTEADAKLREVFAPRELEGPAAAVLAFARARVLHEKYHMNPLWMLELMEGRWFVHPDQLPELEREGLVPSIPVDWRHPAAHGLYWSALGTKKSQGLLKPEDFDLMNNDRQVLHGLQQMLHRGRYTFDYLTGYLQASPDVAFIDAYHFAMRSAGYRIISERIKGSAAPESFEAGHENFLIWSIQQLYFEGQVDRSDFYYRVARKLYGFREAKSPHRYTKPLKQFVRDEFQDAEAITDKEAVAGLINGSLRRAIFEGLVVNRPDITQQYMKMAREIYDAFTTAQDYRTLQAFDEVNRMSLEPFNTLVVNALKDFLVSDGQAESLLIRSRIWRNLGPSMQRRLYDNVKPRMLEMAKGTIFETELDIEKAFPEPEGMEDYRQAKTDKLAENPKEDLFESRAVSGQR